MTEFCFSSIHLYLENEYSNLTIKLMKHGIVAHFVFVAKIKQRYGPLLSK